MFRVSGGTAGHLVGNNQACAGFALVISWVQTDSRAVLAKQKKVLRLQLETAEKLNALAEQPRREASVVTYNAIAQGALTAYARRKASTA